MSQWGTLFSAGLLTLVNQDDDKTALQVNIYSYDDPPLILCLCEEVVLAL